MIKKNRRGKVVEFEDETIFKARSVETASRSPVAAVAVAGAQVLPASEHDIEVLYEASVRKVTEASVAATKAEMDALEKTVVQIDAVAKTAREVVKMKLKQAMAEAEWVRRETVKAAVTDCDATMDRIRVDFHASMAPVNAEAEAVKLRQGTILHDALQVCIRVRDEQLVAMAEAKRLDAKIEVVESAQAPAETVRA